LDSLKIIDGILYRQLEPPNESDIIVKQLVLLRSLKTNFLDSVHTGLAGHIGMTKTSAHVTRRAYWYQWRRDVKIYVNAARRAARIIKVGYHLVKVI